MDKKYYLGLDLGISSVGWAVMCEEGDEYYIDDFGVRLFEVAEDPKKGTTHAEERRTFRGARRLNRRRKQRIKEIKDFLRENNIVTDEQLANFYREKKTTNLIKYNEDQYFNPYGLRVKGLTEKLTGEELGVILIHIANSRGYNDKFSFNEEDKKQAAKLDSALNKANLLIQSHKTIAEAIVNEQEFKSKENANLIVVRNRLSASVKKKSTKNNENQEKDNTNNKDAVGYKFLFAREDYRKELNLILEKQTEFYPQLKGKVYKLVEEIILRQRDFESGPRPKTEIQFEKWKKFMEKHPRMKQRFYPNFLSLKAKCNFFKDEERGFMSSLIFDIYHLVVELSKYTVRFSEEENKKVAQAVFNFVINSKEKIDKTEIKKKIEASLDNKHKISTSGAHKVLLGG
ncbi:type II CRISPR RNA-guided endonuclease Cas9 [Spiroplasma endosymbiont of Dilophus febrilis]|uniref:type II CRISPR RNA-guided endonuclease Cas9 n=1 Tax=Spiroplasma endosymbiont of Dilophus febrilis TaxID=3066292 RepID=UPI00313D6FA8